MRLATKAYLLLLAAAGAGRLAELGISRRHQRLLALRGATMLPEPQFRWMVLLHVGVLAGSALEVLMLRRRFRPWPAAVAAPLFLLATLLRWWVMDALGEHWNVRVVDSAGLGVVTAGPYRWIRHPNYVAVFLELASLPLIHCAWLTALLGSLANLRVLRRRIAVEEAVLMANPRYVALMASKPRFLPRLGRA